MATLELHPETSKLLRQLSDSLPQGILLKGSVGVGLLTIARQLAGTDLATIIMPTDKDGAATDARNGEIRIGQIRELAPQLRGKSTTRRVVIIDDSDQMSIPAQNAFLKLLEEPTPHTHFILTAHQAEKLLPTILSRVQSILIRDVSREQSLLLIKRLGETDPRRTQQLQFLASGRPAQLTRLIRDRTQFEKLATAVEDARQYLGGSISERIEVVQKYHNDRSGAVQMVEQAICILETTLRSKPSPTTISSANSLTELHARLQQNGNVRLQLLDFVL